jgi:hypothetical protein
VLLLALLLRNVRQVCLHAVVSLVHRVVRRLVRLLELLRNLVPLKSLRDAVVELSLSRIRHSHALTLLNLVKVPNRWNSTSSLRSRVACQMPCSMERLVWVH